MGKTKIVYIRSVSKEEITGKATKDDGIAVTVVYDIDAKEYIVSSSWDNGSSRHKTWTKAIRTADVLYCAETYAVLVEGKKEKK